MRAAFSLVLVGLLAGQARADSTVVDQMEKLARSLRYEEAIALGDRALRTTTPNDRDQLAAIYRIMGSCHLLAGDEVHARFEFLELLAIAPSAKLPDDSSPKLRSFFDRLSLVAAGVGFGPARLIPGPPRVETPARSSLVDSVILYHRNAAGEPFSALSMKQTGDRFVAELPAAAAMQVWLEARDASAQPIALQGSEAAPLTLTVDAITPRSGTNVQRTDRPVWRRGWFWAVMVGAVAVVATGVALGAYYGTRSSPSYTNLDVCIGLSTSPCAHP